MIVYKLIAILAVIIFIIYKKNKKIFSFWEKRGVKGPKPNWLVGNMWPVIRKQQPVSTFTKQIYDKYPSERVVGIYQFMTPTLIVRDPNLIKNILVKDFGSFSDRGLKVTNKDMLLNNIFLEHGEKWKVYRQKLTRFFTTSTFKAMFPNIVKHIEEYFEYIDKLPTGPKELRALEHKLSVKFVMSDAFGVTVDPYNKEDTRNFEKIGYGILELSKRDIIGTMLYGFNPSLPSAIGYKVTPPERKEFLEMIINESIKAKEVSPDREETTLDTLLKLKEQGVTIKENKHGFVKVDLSDSFQSHALLFYTAGFEVFVSASFLLFELALHQRVQERCYSEIVQVMDKYNGDLTYEAFEELKYLNMAFDECIRKYPVGGGVLIREAMKDYHFEDMNLTIEKGTRVIIPTLAIQNDPKFFPNPDVFEPERFLPENKNIIHDGAYLPFGDGPRKCLGFRLARFQVLVLVVLFLHRYRVTPCEKTVPKVRFMPYQFSFGVKDGLWVNIVKRE